jgi:hypothetical protein
MAETVTLVSGGWRIDVSAEIRESWQSALAGAIGINRIEPIAIVSTSDVDQYDFSNGWFLERGSDVYRITAQADSDIGETTLTLAKT